MCLHITVCLFEYDIVKHQAKVEHERDNPNNIVCCSIKNEYKYPAYLILKYFQHVLFNQTPFPSFGDFIIMFAFEKSNQVFNLIFLSLFVCLLNGLFLPFASMIIHIDKE